MAYQDPSFMLGNVLEDVTDPDDVDPWTNTNAINDDNSRRMIDGRVSTFGLFTSTGTPSGVRFSPPAAPSPAANRCIIPPGHDFDGLTLDIYHDTSDSFATATNVASLAVSGAGLIDLALSSGNERYWLVRLSGTGSDTWQFAGAWIGERRTLSSSVAIGTDFGDDAREGLVEEEVGGGVASLQLWPARRRFTLEVRNVSAGSADETTLDAIRDEGRGAPFWYWPPDDAAGGPFYCRLEGDARKVQEFPAPQVSVRYRYQFSMLETNL